jgi:hypothetical protein
MRSMIVLAGLVLATPAVAGFDSAYTDLILDDKKLCKNLSPPPVENEPNDSAYYECKGFKDYIVMFSEGDLRSSMAYGRDVKDHCAATQSFAGFNSVGTKIEWRLKDGEPVATILRWSVSYDPEDSTKLKTWLVVTKLAENDSCHMGYIEGGYPNANEMARALADRAENYNCVTDRTTVLAKTGTYISDIDGRSCAP